MLRDVLLAASQVVTQQQVKHAGRFFHIRRLYLDQAAALRVHGGQPHHLRVVLAQTFRALDRVFFVTDFLQEGGLLRLGIRGKILNCLKADYARIFKSDVIVDLIKVMGCGVELGGKHNKELATFNLDNLRYNKIVICTDADVDGYQIRTLVLTMLYRLTPTLINEGYVYIAESPLYEINTKDHTYFAYT